MLCRLNHELLPDPGSPIARTTVPLLGRAVTGTVWAGAFPVTTGFVSDASAADAPTAECSAATDGAAAAAPDRERPPPRPPRLRRRRAVRGLGSPAADAVDDTAASAETGAGAGSGAGLDGRRDSTTGGA